MAYLCNHFRDKAKADDDVGAFSRIVIIPFVQIIILTIYHGCCKM